MYMPLELFKHLELLILFQCYSHAFQPQNHFSLSCRVAKNFLSIHLSAYLLLNASQI